MSSLVADRDTIEVSLPGFGEFELPDFATLRDLAGDTPPGSTEGPFPDLSNLPPPAPGYVWTIDYDPDAPTIGPGGTLTYGAYIPAQVRSPSEGSGAGAALSAAAARYGADLNYALGLAELAEAERANRSRELEDSRRRALDAASAALGAFVTGTDLAGRRREAAFSEARQLLPFLAPPGQEFFSGLGPGDPLAAAFAARGGAFEPVPIVHKQLRPGALAEPVSPEEIGTGILDFIERAEARGAA